MHVLNLVTNPNAEFFQQQLSALQRQGITTDTVGVPDERTTTDEGTSTRSVLAYLRFYPRVLRESFGSVDLVHANYGLTGPAALAQPRRPVVLSLWGSDLLGSFGWLSKLCAKQADAVIVMTEEMADTLGSIDAHVIPHGVDLSRFRPLPADFARDRLGWSADSAHVLFPYAKGRPIKDYPRAESIVQTVRNRREADVELHAISDVAHAEMPLYMNAADALLVTSKREGSPNVVKEAMACNLPVVATDVGDVGDRLSGVWPSHVCRSDADLEAALEDVLDRSQRSNGRRHVAALSSERMGEQIRDVYESVL